MADTATPRPVAPTSGGAVRFCWTSIDRWGRSRTMSIRAKDCPDPAKAREAIEAMLDTDVRVEPAR